MKNGQNVNKPELSSEEKNFALDISKKHEIPCNVIESHLSELRLIVNRIFKSNDLIGKIDYRGKPSSKESWMIKSISNLVLGIIYEEWQLGNYKKCVIAGKVLIHYKLDKYERIKTAEEFDINPTDSAPNYNRYLYDRMRSRFKTIKNQRKRFCINH